MNPEISSPILKTCKVCAVEKVIGDFSRNPNAVDGFNAICKGCRGKSPTTERGRDRIASDQKRGLDIAVAVEEAMGLFRMGDLKKDFLMRQLLTILLTPGTNQQSQLTAATKIMELHGLGKETPKSEEDFVHAALNRLRDQASKK